MTDEPEEGPVSRREARSRGRARYFTGKPCREGHVAERYVCNKHCVKCQLDRQLSKPALIKARQQRYRERHRDACNERVRRHNAANPGYYVTKTRNRRARIRGNGGNHKLSDIQAIFKKQHGRCAICTKKLGKQYHVDHIVSLKCGGLNDRSNIQITCPFCNMSKGARDPIEHAWSLGRLL